MPKLKNYFPIWYKEIHFFKSVQNLTEIKDNLSKSSKKVLFHNLFKFYVLNALNFFKIKNIWFKKKYDKDNLKKYFIDKIYK